LSRLRFRVVVRSSRQHLESDSAQQITLSEQCVSINTTIPPSYARISFDKKTDVEDREE
jgi:hypothetical protein